MLELLVNGQELPPLTLGGKFLLQRHRHLPRSGRWTLSDLLRQALTGRGLPVLLQAIARTRFRAAGFPVRQSQYGVWTRRPSRAPDRMSNLMQPGQGRSLAESSAFDASAAATDPADDRPTRRVAGRKAFFKLSSIWVSYGSVSGISGSRRLRRAIVGFCCCRAGGRGIGHRAWFTGAAAAVIQPRGWSAG